jgi:sulfide dehydrogenase cytochrome subunit
MKLAHICISVLAFVLTGPALAADVGSITPECESCHGPGQSREYISKSLRSFQMWDRPCVKSSYRHGDTDRPKTDMCKVVEGLAYEDINALSDHYSQQAFVAAKQPFDESKAAAGAALHEKYCETCHSEGGTAASRGPRLAGQWVPYLKSALHFVPTGEHLVPPMMERAVSDLSSEEIDMLMDYYASQKD